MGEILQRTLLAMVGRHPSDRPAVTELSTGSRLTYGQVRASASRCIAALQRLGLHPGDVLIAFAGSGPVLLPLFLACSEIGLDLALCGAKGPPPGEPAAWRGRGPKLVVGPDRLRGRWPRLGVDARWISIEELERDGVPRPETGERLRPGDASVTFWPSGGAPSGEPASMRYAALARSASNFCAAYPVSAEDVFLTASSVLIPEGLCTAAVIPMALGAHAVLANASWLDEPATYWANAEAVSASVCELPAPGLLRLLDADPEARRAVPDKVRFLVVGSGVLADSRRLAAERSWKRRVHRGYGTTEVGYWAACSAHGGSDRALRLQASAGLDVAIRPLRTPLASVGTTEPPDTGDGATRTTPGEVVLRHRSGEPGTGRAGEHRTGDIGWLTATGGLVVRGKLADVAVRGGRAVPLAEVDALLQRHPGIASSKTFREHGRSPAERFISACATDVPGPEIRAWLADRIDAGWMPDRVVSLRELPPGPGLDACVATLRSMVNGDACDGVVEALTSRRFRRAPCHKEAELRRRAQSAIMAARPLELLMFWGCGPRREVAGPDLAALAALGQLLDAVRRAAPVEARADVIFTDVHAAGNGYPEGHSSGYFGQIERAAAGFDVAFHRESAIWARGGLTRELVLEFTGSVEFEAKWRTFPLRDRFVAQAERHSRRADRVGAARGYYATCLLEREVFRTFFPRSIFLTYNGPEFNECFPDLPTLYVYPGPRGRTDKPWFVHGGESQGVAPGAEGRHGHPLAATAT